MARRSTPLVIVFTLLVAYTIGSTVLLNGRIPALVNTWSDGFIHYRWAISFLPGIVHLFGFEIRHQDQVVQWNSTIGFVTTGIDLFALSKRKFHAYFVTGSNVTYRFRLKKDLITKIGPLLPPFEGIPQKAERVLEPGEKPKPKWGVNVQNIHLSGLREIWFQQWRFEGKSSVKGGFEIIPDTLVTVAPAVVEFQYGGISTEGTSLLNPVSGKFDVTLDPFDPKAPDLEDMRFVSFKGKIQSQVTTLDFLNRYFLKVPWLRAVSGQGPLEISLQVVKGRLLPPVELAIHSKDTVFDILDNRLRGDAHIDGRIQEGKEKKLEAVLTLNFDKFEVADPKTQEKHLEGDGFKIIAKTDQLDLATLFSKLTVDLDLKDARVPRLSYYNKYLPPHGKIEILDGDGKINASIQADSEGLNDRGRLEVLAGNACVKYASLTLTGQLRIDAPLKHGSIAKRRFDISETRIRLENVFAKDGNKAIDSRKKGWSGEIWAPQAKFQLGTPVQTSGLIRCKLRDVKPILAIYNVKNPLPESLEKVAEIVNLQAAARFQINKDIVDFKEIDVQGDGFRLRGRIRLLPWESRVALLANYNMLSVGLGRINEDSRTVVHEAEKWFSKEVNFLPVQPGELGAPVNPSAVKSGP